MEDNDESSITASTVVIFKKGSTIILMLLLLAASFGFYFSAQAAIYDLFDYRYNNLIRSIFNLVVVIAVLYIIKKYILEK